MGELYYIKYETIYESQMGNIEENINDSHGKSITPQCVPIVNNPILTEKLSNLYC